MATRKPYPSDVSDEEWAFVAPYLALVREDAPQREYDLREVLKTGSEVDREDRLCLALHAPRPASVGGHLPANAAVAQSGCLRGDDPRSARIFAAFEGPGFGAFGGNTGLSHAEIHSRERPSGRLRRTQGQEGLQGACGGGHFGTPARP